MFIPLFPTAVLLLSKTRIKRGIIDFTGVLSLLMLFEFIAILIHPRVVEITNHTPSLELIILVMVASMLVPLHHRLTHWLKARVSKISTTPKKISDNFDQVPL